MECVLLSKRAEAKTILEDAARVSGNRNFPSERFWSKSEEMWIWDVAPK